MKSKAGLVCIVLGSLAANCLAQDLPPIFPLQVGDRWGYVDQAGKMVVEPTLEAADEFLSRPLARIKAGGRWGALDRQGRVAVEPKFQNIATCSESDLLPVQVDGKWGYLDMARHAVIDLRFERADCFGRDGLASARVDGKWGMIDRSRQWVVQPQLQDFSHWPGKELFPALVDGKWGFMDRRGKFRIEPVYEDAGDFGEVGLAPVRLGNKWGFIDEQGRMAIAPQFAFRPFFSKNGLAAVRLNDKEGFIDARGRMVIPPRFQHLGPFAPNGLAVAQLDGTYGYIDATGRFAIPPRFDAASTFAETGWAAARFNGKWGFIDQRGEFVIAPKYQQLLPFNPSGLARAELRHAWGYIDRHGEAVAMPVQGCGSAIVLGKGNVPTWVPPGQDGTRILECILWSQALADIDPGAIKSLLDRGYRAPTDDATLIRVARTSSGFEHGSPAQADFELRQAEAVRLLLSRGASPNATIQAGNGPARTLLLDSILSQRTAVALALIEHGARLDAAGCPRPPGCDSTPLVLAAVASKNLPLATALLKRHGHADAPAADGETALGHVLAYQPTGRMRACAKSASGTLDCKEVEAKSYDRLAWLRLLLEHGADPNRPTRNRLPLMASRPGDLASIRLLLEYGARLGAPAETFKVYGVERTVGSIMWTLLAERGDLLPIALAQACSKQGADDRYAIGLAADRNRPEVVDELLKCGADANLSIAEFGQTLSLLHRAALAGQVEVARRLIAGGAKLDARTETHTESWPAGRLQAGEDTRFTPLMLASMRGQAETVALLLEKGADRTLATDRGQTATTLAANAAILKLLQDRPGKPGD